MKKSQSILAESFLSRWTYEVDVCFEIAIVLPTTSLLCAKKLIVAWVAFEPINHLPN